MSNDFPAASYDRWKIDPDPHGDEARALEERERAEEEEQEGYLRNGIKSDAFDHFATFMYQLDNAKGERLQAFARKIKAMPELLRVSEYSDEIQF